LTQGKVRKKEPLTSLHCGLLSTRAGKLLTLFISILISLNLGVVQLRMWVMIATPMKNTAHPENTGMPHLWMEVGERLAALDI